MLIFVLFKEEMRWQVLEKLTRIAVNPEHHWAGDHAEQMVMPAVVMKKQWWSSFTPSGREDVPRTCNWGTKDKASNNIAIYPGSLGANVLSVGPKCIRLGTTYCSDRCTQWKHWAALFFFFYLQQVKKLTRCSRMENMPTLALKGCRTWNKRGFPLAHI